MTADDATSTGPAKKRRERATPRDKLAPLDAIAPGDTIERIKPTRNPERWTLETAAGARATIHTDVLTRHGLGPGVEWTPELACAVRGDQQRALAYADALGVITRSVVTRARLMTKLRSKGHETEAAQAAADRLEHAGLLDDRRASFAAARAIANRNGGAGRRLIESKLRAQGVHESLAREATDEALADRDSLADATALAQKKWRTLRERTDAATAKRRIAAALARRGFDLETVWEAVRRVVREGD